MRLFFCSCRICPRAIAVKCVRDNYVAGCAVSCRWWIRNWCGSNLNQNRTDSPHPNSLYCRMPSSHVLKPGTEFSLNTRTHTHTQRAVVLKYAAKYDALQALKTIYYSASFTCPNVVASR
jgi:hypothetical protein